MASSNREEQAPEHHLPLLQPQLAPRIHSHCGVPAVLRRVTKQKETRGRSFFRWAGFDDDGEPSWKQ
ncbi:hypothetical protein P280DRAFT_469722 [Massarina eburnea CBS 473.64]|uniref:Uncharacterized protein n=1 Tax=Massarina eburnea CBS 473.64 TaxID=1395130 RepID=A0A6A6S183_9PLEO|nr:hypothetical protein P280DRAFT_469722 [Massarina eburnea CBS 473.64]